jgi:hypothetical protein
MGFSFRVKVALLFGALKATCRHVFRTGYFPREWPLKLSIIMGVTKTLCAFFPENTVEEVLYC